MSRCVNCGNDIVTVREDVNWGCVMLGCLLGPIGMLAAVIYQVTKPRTMCPTCGNPAFKRQPSATTALYCRECGHQLKPKNSFCTKCGKKVY